MRSLGRSIRRPEPFWRRGTVVVAMVVALVLLQLVVVAVVVGGARDHDLTSRRVESARTFYAAEGVLGMGIREFVLDSDLDGDGDVGGVSTVSIGGAAAGVSRSDNGEDTTLTAGGAGGMARRRLSVVLRHSVGDPAGVAVEVWHLGSAPSSLASVPWLSTPSYVGVVPDISFASQANSTPRYAGMPTSRIGMRFTARVEIPTDGDWTFFTSSDDGSDLWIDGSQVVNNDGLHGMTSRSGTVALTAGRHDVEVRFFEDTGSNGLIVSWQGPGMSSSEAIPASAFTTTREMPALAAHSTMDLYGDNSGASTLVDGYSSADGAYGGVNVLSSGAVAVLNSTTASSWRMNGQAMLQGSAVVGPGSSPGSVIWLADSSSITGTSTSAASRTAIFALQSSITTASNGNLSLSGTGAQAIASSGRWNNITLTDTSVLTLSGAVIVRVDGDLTMDKNARIELAPGAEVAIYLAGGISLSNNAIVNASTADAWRLRVYMNGVGKNIQIRNRARMSAYVLNPLGRLDIAPQGGDPHSFAGRFAGDGVLTADKADIHLDVESGAGASTGSAQMASWGAEQP